MGLGLRVFLIDTDGQLTRIPFALFDRIEKGGNIRLPRYAQQRVWYALVFLNLHKRILISIARVEYGVLAFDSTGAVDKKSKQKELCLIRSPLEELDTPESERDYFRARFKWKPNPRLERRIKTLALAR
jgi:hypothetical protein